MKQSFAPNSPFNLVVHEDFERDLDELEDLSEGHADLAADIAVYLDELREQPELLGCLLEDRAVSKTGSSRSFNIRELIEAKKHRYNLWRIRILDDANTFGAYRIIYAYNSADRTFYVLGLMQRADEYDPRLPKLRRILECYNRLDLQRW